ncbi:MAG: HesA/MoeB/ThiF family protein [Candidatus Aminicenantes bacterium]|nr:MAG: HesA/MoeB/ThiF family protein [Candidatus Aminicenantes bacterium]
MSLSDLEKERYFKQLSVRDWNQERLKSAKVLIVGIGGLGSASALYFTAAGVGKLRLCDEDKVERSNLNRQVLYFEESIGKIKVEEAKKRLAALNPNVEIEAVSESIGSQNADELTKGCDIIVDGLDSIESRFLLNEQSVKMQIPYVYGAVQGWQGYVSLFHPPHTACLACILPKEAQTPDTIPIPGVLPGVIGIIQATEALKFIMGVEKTLAGSLLIYDSQHLTFDIVEIEKNPSCTYCAP